MKRTIKLLADRKRYETRLRAEGRLKAYREALRLIGQEQSK